MPVSILHMRDLLLPGLWGVSASCRALEGYEKSFAAPHIWVPKVTLPQAVAMGAAAAVMKNPAVTRRFWAGWK